MHGSVYFGIQMKPGFTFANLLAMPICFAMVAVVGTYTNTQMIFLLRSEKFYNVP
jgi:hypothetical protein